MSTGTTDDPFHHITLTEPWGERKARTAQRRAASIAKARDALAETCKKYNLPAPASVASISDAVAKAIPMDNRSSSGRKPNSARAEAVAKGEKFYMGRRCRFNHSGLRYTKNSSCLGCARANAQKTNRRRRELH